MFSYYAARGVSLLDRLEQLYADYGYCLNTLHSYTYDGSCLLYTSLQHRKLYT